MSIVNLNILLDNGMNINVMTSAGLLPPLSPITGVNEHSIVVTQVADNRYKIVEVHKNGTPEYGSYEYNTHLHAYLELLNFIREDGGDIEDDYEHFTYDRCMRKMLVKYEIKVSNELYDMNGDYVG